MRLLLFITIVIVATSCSSLPARNSVISNDKVGWLHGDCIAIKNPDIPSQYQFTLIHLDNEGTPGKAIIVKKATNGEECYPLLEDRASINKGAGYSFYTVKSDKLVNLAIGLLSPEDNSVSELKFSYCNTSEGINFSISRNRSNLWEGYYYLGYESEPTCTSE